MARRHLKGAIGDAINLCLWRLRLFNLRKRIRKLRAVFMPQVVLIDCFGFGQHLEARPVDTVETAFSGSMK
jgi:hypothetical protein